MIDPPQNGKPITIANKKLKVPSNPIIPVIEGDGIGRDTMKAPRRVVDAAVEKSYGGKKEIVWFDIYAGEAAMERYGEVLPKDTFNAIKHFIVALKGPLTTPVGGGYRSLNVTLRQVLTLYACVRPVRYFQGVPAPVKHPEKMNVVIFRENTEDVYAGIEWAKGTKEARKIIDFLNKSMKVKVRSDSGIGIKPISVTGTQRLVRKAIRYALENNRSSVTLVHKGNIMKYTEGAFRDWGYKLAAKEFPTKTISEDELWSKYNGEMPKGKILIKDRIADSMFQQILTRTDEYEVVATPNLNGDYLSDACAAQAPKYADKDMVNPGSLILSAVMMLDYLGWKEAAKSVENSMEKTILNKTVTYDLHRQMEGATKVSTSQYATHIINNL
jgi:isocitrate dehydrogenase